ncbi:hypothetical protein SAMN03097699_3326 [Flavobacteriaceae bacterium MAR_2010_188]|nr:hypothetical protein SAMN03097699_3326 [Flavobacteriaceae bacterium MAR_2010_188]
MKKNKIKYPHLNSSKRIIIGILLVASIMWNCSDEKSNPFLVEKNHVGMLTDSTKVMDLKQIFEGDSIANLESDQFRSNVSEIDIYSKEGKKLLTLTPSSAMDSTATISNVQIFSEDYKTAKNVSTLSTFKDINDNYKISKINNLINAVVISVNEINASFTIDKKELPAHLQYDSNAPIEKSQIPDNAKIKYFMIYW